MGWVLEYCLDRYILYCRRERNYLFFMIVLGWRDKIKNVRRVKIVCFFLIDVCRVYRCLKGLVRSFLELEFSEDIRVK